MSAIEKNKKNKVLVVSTSRKTRGGITAVIKAYEGTQMWRDYHCHWVGTHVDRGFWTKLWYFLKGIVEFCALVPFYDIVHIHYSLRTTAKRKRLIVKISKLFRKKIISHLHCGTQIDEIWNHDYEYIINNSERAIFLSRNLQSVVEKYTGPSEKFTVVYNPCINGLIESSSLKKKEILFAGTLYDGKGYKDFIRAFSKIAKLFPDWNIVLAGNGEVEQAKSLAYKLGIANQTKLLGWIEGDVKDRAFKTASIFCLPSYAEGFPMAVLDAFSYGLPVITTPVGGIPDIAINGENMLLVHPGDVDALAKAMKELISNDVLRDKLSKASTNFASTTFNLQTVVNEISAIYDSIK